MIYQKWAPNCWDILQQPLKVDVDQNSLNAIYRHLFLRQLVGSKLWENKAVETSPDSSPEHVQKSIHIHLEGTRRHRASGAWAPHLLHNTLIGQFSNQNNLLWYIANVFDAFVLTSAMMMYYKKNKSLWIAICFVCAYLRMSSMYNLPNVSNRLND